MSALTKAARAVSAKFRKPPALPIALGELDGTILVAGRRLRLTGTHAAYMQPIRDWTGEASPVATAVKDLPHGSLCLDIGAHIGLTAIIMAALRPDCHIIAFEPIPAAQALLRRNVEENGITNVEIIDAAVGNHSGHINFDDNGPWSTALGSNAIISKIVRLDDLRLDRPAFIKVDVEGLEPDVLDGGRQLIAESRPLMLVEFNSGTLILHHYDPLAFAAAIWLTFDVLDVLHSEISQAIPTDALAFVHTNIIRHGCVTDLLLRPKGPIPDFKSMVRNLNGDGQ